MWNIGNCTGYSSNPQLHRKGRNRVGAVEQVALLHNVYYPGWSGSVAWAPAYKPKGCWFNSYSEHMLGVWPRSPVGGVWEETDWYFPNQKLLEFLKWNFKNIIFKKYWTQHDLKESDAIKEKIEYINIKYPGMGENILPSLLSFPLSLFLSLSLSHTHRHIDMHIPTTTPQLQG